MSCLKSRQLAVVVSGLPENTVSGFRDADTGRRRILPVVTGSTATPASKGRTCHLCGNTLGNKKATICRQCYMKARRSTVHLNCTLCGTQFAKPLYEYEKVLRNRPNAEFYCGPDCSRKHHAVKNARKCATCNEPMPGNRNNMYCSAMCRRYARIASSSVKPVACPICSAEFTPNSSRKQFCSKQCADRSHSGRMTGRGNSRFSHGRSYAKWFNCMRTLILDRDEYRCVACGDTEMLSTRRWRGQIVFYTSLTVHHIDENPTNNLPENLVTLCKTCHAIHHKSSKTPWPWFGEYAAIRNRSMTSSWTGITTSLQARFSSTTA